MSESLFNEEPFLEGDDGSSSAPSASSNLEELYDAKTGAYLGIGYYDQYGNPIIVTSANTATTSDETVKEVDDSATTADIYGSTIEPGQANDEDLSAAGGYSWQVDQLKQEGATVNASGDRVPGTPYFEVHLTCKRGKDASNKPIWVSETKNDPILLHTTNGNDLVHRVLEPKLKLEIGEPGSFSFTILPNHPLYYQIYPMKTGIYILNESVEIFYGRVTSVQTNLDMQKSVTCEGALGFLKDSQIKIGKFSGKEANGVEKLFKQIVSSHNGCVGSDRKFTVGTISAAKAPGGIDLDEDSYTDARSAIDNILDAYGGYLRAYRNQNGSLMLDLLTEYSGEAKQTISFGVNIIDFKEAHKTEDLFTVLIPEGDSTSDTNRMTIAKATVKDPDGIVHKSDDVTIFREGSKLVWDEGRDLYGDIYRAETFSGITKGGDLLTRATEFFVQSIKSLEGDLSIRALDRHILNPGIEPIRLGDLVHIVVEPHGISTDLTAMSIDYDLNAPENTEYEFDKPYKLLKGPLSRQKKKLAKESKENKARGRKNSGGVKKNAEGVEKNKKGLETTDGKVKDLSDKVSKLDPKKLKDIISFFDTYSISGKTIATGLSKKACIVNDTAGGSREVLTRNTDVTTKTYYVFTKK